MPCNNCYFIGPRYVHRRPVLVNHGDDALEVDGIVKLRRALRENIGEQAADFAELAQNFGEQSPIGTTDNSPAILRQDT